ncbi:hypothetical protein [Aquabacterium sp.]|uniref:hypothetical protein n=1 Tax=Aquabacterium sp. TaxID=1872578 RepID=UPI0035B44C25
MNDLPGYLAVLADSDLFGSLATLSLVVALLGLSNRVRQMRLYQGLAFVCLLFMPILFLIGILYLNKRPA